MASPSVFTDILCHTFAVSGVLYSEGVVIGTRELRTEQRHTKSNYLNDDLAAIALPVDKCKSGVCPLVCPNSANSGILRISYRKFSLKPTKALWSDGASPNLCENCDRLQSRQHYSESAGVYNAGKGHLLIRKAIVNDMQKMKVRQIE